MKKVVIVGVGLIGGSLGLALKEKKLAEEVVGVGRRWESLDKALKVKAIDRATLNIEEAMKGVDLVVIATPVGSILEMVKRSLPALPRRALLTDVGSTKEKVARALERILPEGVSFIGAHPLAGSEKKGVEAARADLFQGSVCVLTPGEAASPEARERISSLWKNIGAKVLVMKPEEHDLLIAATSHLPHLLAAVLVNLAGDLAAEDKRLFSLIAGGFRDTTRIAASPPELWRDICLDNRENLSGLIDKFITALEGIKRQLSERDASALEGYFARAKAFRDKI